jgi:hypothetical protein
MNLKKKKAKNKTFSQFSPLSMFLFIASIMSQKKSSIMSSIKAQNIINHSTIPDYSNYSMKHLKSLAFSSMKEFST